MPIRGLRLVALGLLAAVCAACETVPGPPETLEIRAATQVGTRVARNIGRSSGVPCGLDREPIFTLPEPAAGEAQAGFDNRRTEGGYAPNDPTACDRWKFHEYTASFVFDLSDIGERVLVDAATLRFDRRPSAFPWRTGAPGGMAAFSCQIEVRMGSAAWTDPYDVGGPGTTFAVVPGPYASRVGMVSDPAATETNSLNVQGIVTRWLTRGEPNNGFVLKQRMLDGSGPSNANSDSCTNIYSNPTLALTIRRFVPRP
jgi:hypothetical protein